MPGRAGGPELSAPTAASRSPALVLLPLGGSPGTRRRVPGFSALFVLAVGRRTFRPGDLGGVARAEGTRDLRGLRRPVRWLSWRVLAAVQFLAVNAEHADVPLPARGFDEHAWVSRRRRRGDPISRSWLEREVRKPQAGTDNSDTVAVRGRTPAAAGREPDDVNRPPSSPGCTTRLHWRVVTRSARAKLGVRSSRSFSCNASGHDSDGTIVAAGGLAVSVPCGLSKSAASP